MQSIKKTDSLEAYQKKMAHNRRVKAQAKAVIKRSKLAGIPDKYMRINQSSFLSLLDDNYHNNPQKVSDFIYKTPMALLKKEFIIIDGGGVVERKRASYAILFRLIACDKYGSHWNNNNLSHLFRDNRSNFEGMYRNDITGRLRSMDVVSISEILMKDFPTTFDTGRFYDDFLSFRDDHVKTTILSFSNPLSIRKSAETDKNTWSDQERFGQYICSSAQSDRTKDSRFLRIRVKQNG